jgi:hypothetical protein
MTRVSVQLVGETFKRCLAGESLRIHTTQIQPKKLR